MICCLHSVFAALAASQHGKTVYFIRHGQSEGNAAGLDKDHADPQYLDSPLTSRGRTQARSWHPAVNSWCIEIVLVSPLIRALETAAILFERVPSGVSIQITPSAREGWWTASENRGRLAAGLLAGTETGAAGEPVRWPAISDLPASERIVGLERVEAPSPAAWDPVDENEFLALSPATAEACWIASLGRLEDEIMACDASTIAVVCHWGVIKAFLEVNAPNCGVVKTRWWVDERTRALEREVCEPALTPPMDQIV